MAVGLVPFHRDTGHKHLETVRREHGTPHAKGATTHGERVRRRGDPEGLLRCSLAGPRPAASARMLSRGRMIPLVGAMVSSVGIRWNLAESFLVIQEPHPREVKRVKSPGCVLGKEDRRRRLGVLPTAIALPEVGG